MPELHIKEIAEAVDGTLVTGKKNKRIPACRFSHYHFDTREITRSNTLFFALKTENSDGHRFLRQLGAGSGAGAVVSRGFPGVEASRLSIPLIRVEDPLKAAQQLAVHVRNTHRHVTYIGITGSAGKTTTKEFIYQLLSHKANTYRSFKNWNNWIGLPFSLLNMTGREEAAVFELAMSFPGIGEIDLLARILRPDVAVILNVYPVHLEFLKTVENAAKAKSEILDYLAPDDVAFVNGDCEPLREVIEGKNAVKGRKIFFGCTDKASDIRLKKVLRLADDQPANRRIRATTKMVVDVYGRETEFLTPFINRTHIENLFVAIIVALHLGMKHGEIQSALQSITPMSNRGQIRRYRDGDNDFTIIDETYNSNPEALKKTLDWVDREYKETIKEGKGEKIAVLGDMLELGEREDLFHREAGQFFAALGFDRLITVGKRALHIAEGAAEKGFKKENIHTFDSAEQAGKYMKQTVNKGSVLLFKASRGIQLEKSVEGLLR
jgi:UDP-N-acetylmuramoyl-tripeptide--D-alanyl-D-alanine ligase